MPIHQALVKNGTAYVANAVATTPAQCRVSEFTANTSGLTPSTFRGYTIRDIVTTYGSEYDFELNICSIIEDALITIRLNGGNLGADFISGVAVDGTFYSFNDGILYTANSTVSTYYFYDYGAFGDPFVSGDNKLVLYF